MDLSRGIILTELGTLDTDIDWTFNFFKKSISGNVTLTFSNVDDDKMISIAIANTSGGSVTVTFPGTINNLANDTIPATTTRVYTFVHANDDLYCTAIA